MAKHRGSATSPVEAHSPGVQRSNAYGLVVVAASFLVQGTIVGAIFSYSVFFDALYAEFGWSRAVLSGASSASSLVMGFGAMVLGRMNDRVGPRVILSGAAVSISLGYFLLSRISSPWQLYLAYGLFVGVAFGAHDVVTLSTVARWYERSRGKMSGIVKTGTSTGQVLAPPAVAFLIATFGWRSAFVWIAAITGPLVMVAAQFLRTPSSSFTSASEPLRRATRASTSAAEEEGSPRAAGADDAGNPAAAADAEEFGRAALRSPAFRGIAVAQLAVFFSMWTVIVHVVPYATDMGVTRGVAAGVLSVIGGVSAAGRLTSGLVVDHIGARRTLRLCYGLMLAAFVMLQFAYTPVLLYVFAVVYGVAHGGTFTSLSPLIAEFFGTTAHGRLFGTVVFIGMIAGALGPVAAGGLFDLIGTYRPVFLLLIALLALAVVVMTRLAAYEPRSHRAAER